LLYEYSIAQVNEAVTNSVEPQEDVVEYPAKSGRANQQTEVEQRSGGGPTGELPTSAVVSAPAISLHRIAQIRTFEVLESDLDRLDALISEEAQALGFFTLFLGFFAPTGIAWATVPDVGPNARAVYASAVVVSVILSIWFGVRWVRVRRERPSLLQAIKRKPRGGR
jgi:hypothetical protein